MSWLGQRRRVDGRDGRQPAAPGRLVGRVARLEREVARLGEVQRLTLAYLQGLDDDLAELEDLLLAGDGASDPARATRPRPPGSVEVECPQCHRRVGLGEDDLDRFGDPIRCPYCGAQLLQEWPANGPPHSV